MDHSNLIRQSDIIPASKLTTPVTVVGCGAIGSFAALALAKMGMQDITLYDFDKVDTVNMSAQFHPFKAIGENKAASTQRMLQEYASVSSSISMDAFQESNAGHTRGIVILAVDTMEARRAIFNWIAEGSPFVNYVIDPRMAAEYYEQYTLNPFDKNERASYMKSMHEDSETVQQRCTAKSTVYTAMLAAGLIAKTVKNIIVGEAHPTRIKWDIKSSNQPLFRMSAVNAEARAHGAHI